MQAMARREGAIDKRGNPIGVGTATDHTKGTGGKATPTPVQSQPAPPSPPPPSTPEPTPEPIPAPVTTVPPVPEPAPTPAPAQEQKQSKAPADPRAASLVEMASTPIDNPGRAALLKPVEKLTETTAAFGRVLQSEDADKLTTAFGRGLGLL